MPVKPRIIDFPVIFSLRKRNCDLFGEKMESVLLEKDFLAENLDSSTFYNLLPTDNVVITTDGAKKPVGKLANRLMQVGIEELSINDLDDLAIALINDRSTFREFSDWQALAHKMALQYTELILNEKARELRMKICRINYFIRSLLDENIVVEHSTEWYIQTKGPWDFIILNDQLLWIDSEENNLKIKTEGSTTNYTCGLPTQIDRINETEIGIGSYYSEGGWIYDGKELNETHHSKPILTFFAWNGATYYVDVDGLIVNFEEGAVGPIDLPFSTIHRCRFFEDRLVFFDWSQPKEGYVYYLETKTGESFNLDPVIICNDICFLSGFYYLVDKLQGYVFKYSLDFNLIDKKSGLGHGKGKLYDPIAIRAIDGELQILNWINGKVVNLKGF